MTLLMLSKIISSILPASVNRRFPPIQWAKKFIIRRLKADVVEIDGHKMFLDPQDSLLLSIRGEYEPFETALIKQSVKPGQVVLDIGANIGYYTLIIARQVGEMDHVFALEPDPTNFTVLKKNVETNGYTNVTLVQKAVSNTTGHLNLYMRDDHYGDHRIYAPGDGRQAVQVEVVWLDDFFAEFECPIDFIKMDIQGAEKGVVEGMTALLKRQNHLSMLTEFWLVGLAGFGTTPKAYLDLLLAQEVELFEVIEEQEAVLPLSTIEFLHKYQPETFSGELKAFFRTVGYTNLLCVKHEGG